MSVNEMREGEKPTFGPGSVTGGGEIKVPSFLTASWRLWPYNLPLCVCLCACFTPRLERLLELKRVQKCLANKGHCRPITRSAGSSSRGLACLALDWSKCPPFSFFHAGRACCVGPGPCIVSLSSSSSST